MSFYSEEELSNLGLKSYGQNVKISRYCRIYSPGSISIGNDVRIDDFCILSASESPFVIGNQIHISAGAYIYGAAGIYIESYSNISAGVKIYTINDDYSGNSLVGPSSPTKHRNVDKRTVIISKYSVIGCNSVILPGVVVGEGAAVGANSLVKNSLDPWKIYAGTPARCIKDRSKNLLQHLLC